MENEFEICSSSLSFASLPNFPNPELEANLDFISFRKLSSSLENLLIDPNYDYTDAEIEVEGKPVGVHRCLLAARSGFFHELFSKGNGDGTAKEARPKYFMSELVGPIDGYVGFEAFDVVLMYLYTGKLKPSPPEVSTCVDELCTHDACRPAIDYAVELMYASSAFQIQELLGLVQRRLLEFIEKAVVEDVIPILLAASRCKLTQLFHNCVQRIKDSNLDIVSLEKQIPLKVLSDADIIIPERDTPLDKRIENIRKALDTDDVELLRLLLKESNVGLDSACALHYAAAYCDPKVFKEVLGLGSADLNLTNSRGLTVLHVAARRKAPSILLPLLEGGVRVMQSTSDGQTALTICRRLTRPKEYNQVMEKGKESNKDRMCIDILEGQMRSVPGKRWHLSEVIADKLHILEYLENRVEMAGRLFPMEARAAMEAAGADWTPLYKGLTSKGSRGNLNDSYSIPNQTPHSTMSSKMLQLKLQALERTVEIGQRYFPNCSLEIVKFLDDLPDALFLERGSEEEQKYKRMRYMELQKDIQKAFFRDNSANKTHPAFPSSSSSNSSASSSAPKKTRKR